MVANLIQLPGYELSEVDKRLGARAVLFIELPAGDQTKGTRAQALLAGYRSAGSHHERPVQLFAAPDTGLAGPHIPYLVIHDRPESKALPPAVGLLVGDVDDALHRAWGEDGLQVFEDGVVGSVGLMMPAVRGQDGRYRFLIGEALGAAALTSNFALGG